MFAEIEVRVGAERYWPVAVALDLVLTIWDLTDALLPIPAIINNLPCDNLDDSIDIGNGIPGLAVSSREQEQCLWYD